MSSHRGKSRFGDTTTLTALALVGAVWFGLPARAQDAQTQAEPAAPPAVADPAPDLANKPGFIDALGRLLDEGRAKFDSQLKDANDKVLELHNKAQDNVKDTAGALLRWPNVLSGRERCELAPNGAPDCRTAAAVLCRGNGFEEGKPWDTQAEDNCPSPSQMLAAGRVPRRADCKTETFVTRAVCQ